MSARRGELRRGGPRLSYLDFGGSGRPLLALHGGFMEAATFGPLAEALRPEWRVLALDQRGHGHSDRGASYGREDYLGDLEAFVDHVGGGEVVLLGHSLGGVNAYQYAARHPGRVRGLVVEDIGAAPRVDLGFVLPWGGVHADAEVLRQRVGERLWPYVRDSVRQVPGGVRLPFEPADIAATGEGLRGDHWADWLGSDCPALLVRGSESRVTTAEEIEEMARRRPRTRAVTLKAGHVVHQDDPEGFAAAVREFLGGL